MPLVCMTSVSHIPIVDWIPVSINSTAQLFIELNCSELNWTDLNWIKQNWIELSFNLIFKYLLCPCSHEGWAYSISYSSCRHCSCYFTLIHSCVCFLVTCCSNIFVAFLLVVVSSNLCPPVSESVFTDTSKSMSLRWFLIQSSWQWRLTLKLFLHADGD